MRERREKESQTWDGHGNECRGVALVGSIDFYRHVAINGSAVDGFLAYQLSDA